MFDANKLNEINTAMNDAVEQMQEGKHLKSQLEKSEVSLTEHRKKFNDLKVQLKKEEKDVEKLQSISFANLFHSLINNKHETLTKEEQEVLAVKVQLDSLLYEITATEASIQSLLGKLELVSGAQKKYEALFLQKKSYIAVEMPHKWQDIERHTYLGETMVLKQKEIKEAIAAGKTVMSCIGNIQGSLNSAAGWGTYDMLGGGMLSTMIKRDHMSKAQEQIQVLEHQLKTFKQEISDVGSALYVSLSINEFLGFADYFFDSFFVDLAVQSKINQARDQISNLSDQVANIMGSLEGEFRTLVTKINEENQKINEIIKGI